MRAALLAPLLWLASCDNKPAPAANNAPAPAASIATPKELCAKYMALADAAGPNKLIPAVREPKEKRCLSRAEGLKASNETGYTCLVKCTLDAKDYAAARGCQESCGLKSKGGKPGGVEGKASASAAIGGSDDDDD